MNTSLNVTLCNLSNNKPDLKDVHFQLSRRSLVESFKRNFKVHKKSRKWLVNVYILEKKPCDQSSYNLYIVYI